MSLVDIQRSTWGYYPAPAFRDNVAPGNTSVSLSAAGHKVAFIFNGAYRGTLTIDSVEFLVGTVTTDGSVDVRVETVDSNGVPTGTLFAANTNGTLSILGADANKIVRKVITADAEVDGAAFAVVVAWASGNFAIQYRHGLYLGKHPYTATDNGGGWIKQPGPPIVGLRQSGGIEPHKPQPGAMLLQTINTLTVNTGTTPDEVGNRIIATTPMTIAGIWWHGDAVGDYDAIVYNESDEVLLSKSVSGLLMENGNGLIHVFFSAGAGEQIPKLTPIRAVIKPTSASNITMYEYDMVLPERLDAWEGGGYASDGIICTSRSDAGAWTNNSAKRVLMGLIVSQQDAGGVATSYARLVNGL